MSEHSAPSVHNVSFYIYLSMAEVGEWVSIACQSEDHFLESILFYLLLRVVSLAASSSTHCDVLLLPEVCLSARENSTVAAPVRLQ